VHTSRNMNSTTRPVRAALLIFGFLAISSFLYVENYLDQDISSTNETSKISIPQQQKQQPPPPQQPQSRRRLQSRQLKVVLDEATQQKQMRSYLGGLYPPVDRDMLPLYLRDTNSLQGDNDLVFFWHIPKASGSTVKNIMNFCFDLKRAEKLNEHPSMDYARNNVLNMDTSSPEGLSFSFANQIVNSGKVDVIVSNYFLSGAALFTDIHNGKTFTILRHPIELALSLFHYRRKATWERSYRKEWMQLSFTQYVNSDQYMDSWMVRQLTGTMPWVKLNENHLYRAKEILKQKIFVGIMSEMDETLRQFKAHFGWEETTPYCAYNYLHSTPTNANGHGPMQGGRGGKTWNMSLYHYALELFAEQRMRYPAPPQ